MRLEIDLDAALAEGILSEHQAIALRNFEAQRNGVSAANAEKFLLFGGLGDLLNAAALTLSLFGLTAWLYSAKLSIFFAVLPPIIFLLCRRLNVRAMPCTATVMMLSFVGFLLFALPNAVRDFFSVPPSNFVLIPLGIMPAIVGAWIFWRTFRLPPTPAIIAFLIALAVAMPLQPPFGEFEQGQLFYNVTILALSFGVLAVAVWWDITDIRRETERSQIAFWLHSCAGFLMTHAAFSMISGNEALSGRFSGTIDFTDTTTFGLTFMLFALLSLLLDRRSLLIGSVLPSIQFFSNFGNEALGMMFAGCCLLFFTLGWSLWRRGILAILPRKIAAQMPRTEVLNIGQRPTRRHKSMKPRTSEATSKGLAMLFGTKSR